jgi:hypothetical protein
MKELLELYQENNKLTNSEKLLLKVLIYIPKKIVFKESIYENILEINYITKYIEQTINTTLEEDKED